jgi:hypothetical protein
MAGAAAPVPRLTLDTSCIIHAESSQGHGAEVEELAERCRQGQAELWLTTAYDEDQATAGDERRAANLRWISERPVIGRIPQPLRLDYSPLDGRSVLVDDQTKDACAAIEEILLPPDLRAGAVNAGNPRWRKRIRDVQHLASHFMHGHDVFVTTDDDDMIDKRDKLLRRTGIVVETPAEVLLRLQSRRRSSHPRPQ